MNYWQAVRVITGWEFRRFLRVRELIATVLVTMILAAGIPLLVEYFANRTGGPVRLAQTGGDALADAGRFTFVPMDEAAAGTALQDGEVDGILDAANLEAPVIVLQQERNWTGELNAVLAELAVDDRLDAAGVTQDDFVTITAPVDLEVRMTGTGVASGTAVIGIVAGAMIFAIFTGTGLLFTAITGEKTQRVTEQIVSAVPPRAWIDGKVLGTGLFVLVNMGTLVLGLGLAVVLRGLVSGSGIPALPALTVNLMILVAAILFALLGGAMYFMLFAAVAATIDDPNTSQRSGIIMLPGLFVGLSFLGMIGSVDNFLFRFLSYFPLTSPTAMPIRLLLGDAGWPEAVISALLLAATVWFARLVAGRIFGLGILMTGKEPSWREMMHWLRRT